MTHLVSYRRIDDTRSLVGMDDGKRNALSLPMLEQLNAALDRAEADGAVMVLTGREGVFSAGFHLPTLAAGGPDAVRLVETGFELAVRLLAFRTPVVVACPGHALAMASFLLLSADYRIGASGPYKIGANEVAIGVRLPRAAIEICRLRLSPAYLTRSLVNAEIYTPDGAVTSGFLDRAVPAERLHTEALDAAAGLGALNPAAHAETKSLLRGEALEAVRAGLAADVLELRARL